jgi:RHS repeat-associated protein
LMQTTSEDGTSSYSYDQTSQLVAADYTDQADEMYRYDRNGNRTNAGYETGANNQLLSDGVYDYAYDKEGNLIRQTEIATGKVTQLSWDSRNRLITVIDQDASGTVTQRVEYRYDLYDRRIAKIIDPDGAGAAAATTERYVYDRDNIALVFDGSGQQTHRYLFGLGIDQVLAGESQGQSLWALVDHQGTVTDVVDDAGVNLNHISYDSFGNVTEQTNPTVLFRFGYTGREYDSETGFIYYRQRYMFDGRFISQDPIGYAGEDTNLYRYVFNSPTNFTDPSGLKQKFLAGDESTILRLGPYSGGGAGGISPPGMSGGGARGITPNYRNAPYNPGGFGGYRSPGGLGPLPGIGSSAGTAPHPQLKGSPAPTFSEEQLKAIEEINANSKRRRKVSEYRKMLQADSTTKDKSCKQCYIYELPQHLGGPPNSKGSRYATYTTGSKGDFLIFTKNGDFAFFDGKVKSNGKLHGAKGVTTRRSVAEAKAWSYEYYKPSTQKLALNRLLPEIQHDQIVASQCKYTYSVVVSSYDLYSSLQRSSSASIYHIPFRGKSKS